MVAGEDDLLVLKQIAGLVDTPELKPAEILDETDAGEANAVSICSITDEVIPRLDGWFDESQERLVRCNGKERYARKFEPDAKPWSLGGSSESSKPVRVLSLGDGPDCDPIALVNFMENLMNATTPGLKPCDAFDLIGGVGVGGLNALFLGRLGFTLDDCPRLSPWWPLVFELITNDEGFTETIWQPMLASEDESLPTTRDEYTFVVANLKNRQDQVLLRTYHGSDSKRLSEQSRIREAMIATGSSVYGRAFWPWNLIEYQDILSRWRQEQELDWEFSPASAYPSADQVTSATNDPIYHAYREARSIWPDREIRIASFMPRMKTGDPGRKAAMEVRGFKVDSSQKGTEGQLLRADDAMDFSSAAFSEMGNAFWADGS
ncbi:uncharacterized protein PV07_11968 [Cladophialophora immunda]|uniref:PNPLA domain-containing protein n=1 Tax=Cladophialophora immunda TaxID=569365 RepID=A0A0D2BZQ2_9EURO|nr:uncharacterized protein PV07_11968 [Cladophialophora immunda]KIW23795.1 hypothetical protein PV07_11968 [Cladophialophora immunda]